MTIDYEATNIDTPKGEADEGDVEALIKGAMQELEKEDTGRSKAKETFTSTPLSAPLELKIEAPIEKPPPAKPAAPASPYENTFKEYKPGDIIQGKVVKVDPAGVMVDIRYKSDGFIPQEEINAGEIIKVGDLIHVFIDSLENKEGQVVLSKKNADFELKWKLANEAYRNKTPIEAKVLSAVKGGLVVDANGIRGFVPASQVDKNAAATLEEFKGKIIPVKIIEVNRRQSKVVMSHKMAAVEKERIDSSKLINELEEGQIRKGRVSSLKNFGAFVDLGGIEGLIHLSELSWKKVKNPADVLKLGQELEVFVLGVDKVNKKVALGLKELQPDPWDNVMEKYKPGHIVQVKVARLVKFGAFVEIDEYLEGLVHISELSVKNIRNPEDAVKPGDVVDAKILRIQPEEQKIGLSIKEAVFDKEKSEADNRRAEESKITIGQMLAEKERQKAEKEAEDQVGEELYEPGGESEIQA